MKGEDVKFVKALSEGIIKPVMNKLLSGEINIADIKSMEKKPLRKTIKKIAVKENKSLKRLVKKSGLKDSSYHCIECGKKCLSKHGFMAHMNTHKPKLKVNTDDVSINNPPNEASTFECENCGKVMHSQDSLEEHSSIHKKKYSQQHLIQVKGKLMLMKNVEIVT